MKSSQRAIGKPGAGAVRNIALGLAISLVESSVANSAYRESATVLNDLLRQLAQGEDADNVDWSSIETQLKEIANMKQSTLGYVWETISYGQGSLQEKQAMALMFLASDLGQKYGYINKQSWGDIFSGSPGRFEKKPPTER